MERETIIDNLLQFRVLAKCIDDCENAKKSVTASREQQIKDVVDAFKTKVEEFVSEGMFIVGYGPV